MAFFLILSWKKGLDIFCKLSLVDSLHEMSYPFSGKDEKTIVSLSCEGVKGYE